MCVCAYLCVCICLCVCERVCMQTTNHLPFSGCRSCGPTSSRSKDSTKLSACPR